MDYDSYRRYPSQAPFSYANYYLNDRNAPLSISHISRPDPRSYPIGNPGTGLRSRNEREDGMPENNGSARKRIAVACARCRKRKIRCSGDPGNGSGCQNCKQAGVDLNQCQFHRVGSSDAAAVFNALGLSTSLGNGLQNIGHPNTAIPMYNAGTSSVYQRPLSATPYHQIDAKAGVYPQTWTVPCPEETSPVETYPLGQSTTYVSNPNTLGNVYNQSYRWNQSNQRSALQSGATEYLEQDASTPYATHGMPFIQTSNIRTTTGAEALSPLNMTSIQSALPISLPAEAHPRQLQTIDGTVPQRHLPMPQPSPAQSTRNTVDLLQDQRLRSTQAVNLTGAYSQKPALTWSGEAIGSDTQSTTSSEASSADVITPTSTSGPVTGKVADSILDYTSTTSSIISKDLTASTSTPSQLNFSTSTLLESMPAPTTSVTYSNFRNYALPTSTSSDSLSILARQPSQSSLYSFSPDSAAKRNSLGPSNEAALVSGQRYTPLGQPAAPQQSARMDTLRRESFESRNVPIQPTSMGHLNRSF